MRVVQLLLVAAVLAVPAASAARAPAAAVAAAKARVVAKYKIGGLRSVGSLRSARNRRWVLVTGFYTRPRRVGGPDIFAVWLRYARGKWTVRWAAIDRRATRPPVRLKVPCDIQPAFSEPFC